MTRREEEGQQILDDYRAWLLKLDGRARDQQVVGHPARRFWRWLNWPWDGPYAKPHLIAPDSPLEAVGCLVIIIGMAFLTSVWWWPR